MTRMKSLRRPANYFMKWKLLSALLGMLLAGEAWATVPLYQNLYPEYYEVYFQTISPNPPPIIDATAFDNENVFSVSYQNYDPYPVLYQTWNTYNYTNGGGSTLIANSPTITNGAYFYFGRGSFGSGFQFDLHTTNLIPDQMGGTFNNIGNIRCDSIQDGNNIFNEGDGFNFYEVTSLGQFKAWATNILCPGGIDVGTGGLIQMTGQNLDLTGGALTVESEMNSLGNPATLGTLNAVNFSSTGAVGTDTNGEWNPGFDLTLVSALSSFVPIPPFYLQITNSQCYLSSVTRAANTNYVINRYVFVLNANTNVPYNVYIDNPDTVSLGFEYGAAHVEWVGSYTDPASGNPIYSYLYLTDNYLFGASTNDVVINGVPENFTFITSTNELLFGPVPQDLTPLTFPDAYITNPFAVMFASLASSTADTNASVINPSGDITNLPGAITISAANTLNLAYASISGPNYLSLYCTNQYEGSPGASITAPYSNIALGVTNGFLTFSNVLMSDLPVWSGTIDAWNTAWTYVDTNGVTNDTRVLLVYSDLKPTASPWIENLYLHATNSLDISDPLDVFGTFYIDARSVTLNTNQTGVGASSPDGEINWLNVQPFNANSGSGVQQMPNLLWLTNNGAIRVQYNANFGNAATPQFVVTPGIAAVRATGKLSEAGTNAVIGDSVTIGTNQYIFVKTLVNSAANQVKWATTFDASMNDLIAAINGALGAGTAYSTATKSNKVAAAGALVSHAFVVTAFSTNAGVGDAIPTLFTPATASSNLTWSGNVTLVNGMDYIPPVTNYTSFVNRGLLSDQGSTIWTSYFEDDGTISNAASSFKLQSGLGLLAGDNIVAGSDVLITITNIPGLGAGGLTLSNNMIQAGRKLTLTLPSNGFLNTVVTNGNIWVVGTNSGGGSADSGINIPVKPATGDLLGTIVTNIAPYNKMIYNVWAGHDFGLSTQGYTNNLALGNVVLDSFGPDNKVAFVFNGAGSNNALYIDCLELKDYATHGNATNNYNFPWLSINTNMMIYYAQALEDGVSVAEDIDVQSQHGANGGRLRWVFSYAGYFSSTNLVYTNSDGSLGTNTVNAALAQSSTIDSDGDGIPNSLDPTPFFLPGEIHLTATVTNVPPHLARIEWTTIPNATNFVYYTTNLVSGNWLAFTNFKNWYYGNNVARTNSAHSNNFISPQIYINNASLPDNSQQTNVWVYDAITNVPHYYKVVVWPWLNYPE
jgi:hypothetical protein